MSYQDLLNKLQFLTQKYQINERDKEELEQNYISIQFDLSIFKEENQKLKIKYNKICEENSQLKKGDYYRDKFQKIYTLYKELIDGELYELNKNYNKQEKELKKLKEENNELLKKNKKQEEEIVKLRIENTKLLNDYFKLNENNQEPNNNYKHQNEKHFQNNNYDYNNNYINAVYNIESKDLFDKIKILNDIKENEDNILYYNYDEIIDENIEEICSIFYNNKKIQFGYNIKFKKPGKYTFRFVFSSNLTTTQKLFLGCKNLVELDFSHFNSESIYNMNGMFEGCINLEKLDLSNFNTSNVRDMSHMFTNCFKLKYLNLLNFNTFYVEDFYQMFCGINKNCELITNNKELIKEKSKGDYDEYNLVYKESLII